MYPTREVETTLTFYARNGILILLYFANIQKMEIDFASSPQAETWELCLILPISSSSKSDG